MPVSLSSAAVGVRLNAPAMSRTHLFYSCSSGCAIDCVRPVPLSPIAQIGAPCATELRIVEQYRSLAFAKLIPQVDAVMRDSAVNWRRPCWAAWLICFVHLSFELTQTPSTFRAFTGSPLKPAIRIFAYVSALRLRVRCISWYFSGANAAP